jgi:hypothetical protein
MTGDFNVVLRNKEKRGGNIVRDSFKENMEDLINDWDMVDIKLVKGKYTCTNHRIMPNHIVSILDRFLVQREFLLYDFIIKSKIVASIVSNHKPIVL